MTLLKNTRRFLLSNLSVFGSLVLGIILNAGCASRSDPSLSTDQNINDSKNFYYDHFIDVYVRENDGATREDAEKFIYDSLLKNIKPAADLLSGSAQKIIIEEYIDLVNTQTVAEFDGDSDEAKSILNALFESTATFGKKPDHYVLVIHFEGRDQPTHVYVQGGLFKVEDKGMYWSQKNIETFIDTLVSQK